MIKYIIEHPLVFDRIRDEFFKGFKCFIGREDAFHGSFTTSAYIGDDMKCIILEHWKLGKTYYAIISDNYHRITVEYGIKIKQDGKQANTRIPKDYGEYMKCVELAITFISEAYRQLEGKL